MKELNQEVLLSADFREHLPKAETLIDLGERKLKGKQQAVRIYGLVDEGFSPPAVVARDR